MNINIMMHTKHLVQKVNSTLWLFNTVVGSGYPAPPSVTLGRQLELGHERVFTPGKLEISKHTSVTFFVFVFLVDC